MNEDISAFKHSEYLCSSFYPGSTLASVERLVKDEIGISICSGECVRTWKGIIDAIQREAKEEMGQRLNHSSHILLLIFQREFI